MKRFKTSYSFIGNMIQFLTMNKQRIKNMLTDYNVQEKQEKLNDGKEITSLIFVKKNIRIVFAPFRVDYEYIYPENNNDVQESLRSAVEFYNLLGEIFYEFKAARLATLTTIILENDDRASEKSLASKLGINNLFGECEEFKFRVNNIKNYFERINSILDIKPGEAMNNKTNQKSSVLIVNIDINTLHDNTVHRFNAFDAEKCFSDLVLEEQEKYNIIFNL